MERRGLDRGPSSQTKGERGRDGHGAGAERSEGKGPLRDTGPDVMGCDRAICRLLVSAKTPLVLERGGAGGVGRGRAHGRGAPASAPRVEGVSPTERGFQRDVSLLSDQSPVSSWGPWPGGVWSRSWSSGKGRGPRGVLAEAPGG